MKRADNLDRTIEESFLLAQTAISLWLVLAADFALAFVGWVWLGLTVLNLASTVVFRLLVASRR